jgi:hypothetical protein
LDLRVVEVWTNHKACVFYQCYQGLKGRLPLLGRTLVFHALEN